MPAIGNIANDWWGGQQCSWQECQLLAVLPVTERVTSKWQKKGRKEGRKVGEGSGCPRLRVLSPSPPGRIGGGGGG